MSSTSAVANFSGADDGWLGYPYRWYTYLTIVPQPHGSRETPKPYFYTGQDVEVGDYIVTAGRGRILKIVSISSKTETNVACILEDENRENILSDITTSGDGGIPEGEGLLFAVKNGLPILHPLPDALASALPPYFSADIIARFFNSFAAQLPTTHNPVFTGDVAIDDKIVHTGDTDTSIRFPAADTFTIETAGVWRLQVDSVGTVGFNDAFGALYSFFHRYAQPVIDVGARVAGRNLHVNPQFANNRTTGWVVYNNSGGTAVTHTLRTEADLQNNIPNASGRALEITYNGVSAVSPGLGGFYIAPSNTTNNDGVSSLNAYRRGQRLVYRIVAKIPSTCRLTFASNAYGSPGGVAWQSSPDGTDNWQEYVLYQQIGSTGTFSSTGFFYLTRLSGTGAVTWHVASCEIKDVDCPPDVVQTSCFTIGTDVDFAIDAKNVNADRFGCLAVGNKVYVKNRIGVGTTSPASALDVNGVITVAATTGADGTYLPSVSFPSDPNTGLGQVSGQSDTVSLFTAGKEHLRVRPDGNIAIGYTGATTHRLGVSGNIAGTGSNVIVLAAGFAQPSCTALYAFYSQPTIAAGTTTSCVHFAAVQGAVNGTLGSQTGFYCSDLTGSSTQIAFQGGIASGANKFNCYMSGSAHNYFVGNIGIGTTNPSAKLSFGTYYINSNTPTPTQTVSHIKLYESGAVQYGLGVSNSALNIGAHQAGASIRFHTADAERLRITGTGQVAIGSTGSANSLQLSVNAGATLRAKTQTGPVRGYIPITHVNVASFMGAAGHVGALALKVPWVSGGGMRFRIRGLEMASGAIKAVWSLDYAIYASASYLGDYRSTNFQGTPPFERVRFMKKGDDYYLFLGDVNTRWFYPILIVDVDTFWAGSPNYDANAFQWETVTDETDYTLFNAVHNIPVDNVYPVTGNVGIGTQRPTSALTVSRDGGTATWVNELQLLRPSSTGTNATKVSGNDQEWLFGFHRTGADSAGSYLLHRSWQPAAAPANMSWALSTGSLYGEWSTDRHGTSVSINADGTRVIVGGPGNSRWSISSGVGTPTREQCGFVRVYHYSPRAGWVRITDADLDGDAAGDYFGFSVGINAAGNAIVVGAPYHSNERGQVKVFDLVGGPNSLTWTQRGAAFVGDLETVITDTTKTPGENLGWSVDMSADGRRIVFGSPQHPERPEAAPSGRAQVWEWDGATWIKMGADILSGASRTQFGRQVCMSRQGNRIAVADSGSSFFNPNPGNVRVYNWTGVAWEQLGQTIVGTTTSLLGFESVALNADGSRLVVGGPGDDTDGLTDRGYVQVYQWDNVSSWVQVGQNLYGDATDRRFGHDVDIDDAGTRIVVGAPGVIPVNFDGTTIPGTNTNYLPGRIYTYELVGTTWTLIGPTGGTTSGGAAAELAGFAVSISGAGNTMVYGEPLRTLVSNAITYDTIGRAAVYNLTTGVQTNRNYLWMSDNAVSVRPGNNSTYVLYADTVNNRVSILTGAPTAALDINSNTMRLRTARTPASATAAGNAGDICWDANYIYVCTATNRWRRAPLSAW